MPDEAYTNGHTKPQAHFRVGGWKPIGKGAVVGVCTVEITLMRIIGVMVMRGSDGSLWVNLPSKPRLDRDGRVLTNANGKRSYETVIEWRSKEITEKFSAQVIAALRAQGVALGDSAPLRQDELAGMLDRA